MRIRFPDDFIWGAATSAYQIEGSPEADGKGPSIWDDFCCEDGRIARGEDGRIAADHYRRWPGDVALLRELGFGAYRFSTAWTRIQPYGRGRPESRGLDFYERLVDALIAAGIEPYLCLYHYDLPRELHEEGGCLGDRVKRFFTHNEPLVAAVAGHFTGEHAPGERKPLQAFRALHHMLLSHGLAYEAIKAAARLPVEVGITLNLRPIHPATDSEEDRAAALMAS
jgi:beta-glucosidase